MSADVQPQEEPMEIFFQGNPGAFAGAVLAAFILTGWQWLYRTGQYINTAASYASYSPEKYEEMLKSNNDSSDIILGGIERHKNRLVYLAARIVHSYANLELRQDISAIESCELLFSQLLEAIKANDKKAVARARFEIFLLTMPLVGKIDRLRNYKIPPGLRGKLWDWAREVEQWEEITLYLRPHFNKPDLRGRF